MKIELLIFEGRPNHEAAERLLRETISELQIDTGIDIVYVKDNDDAILNKFLGSPSIRINGKDIEVEENESTQSSMRCRMYHTEYGLSGIPPKQLIRDTLMRARNRPSIGET